jgi:hypothetical protein
LKSGSLILLEPSGLVQDCNGIGLPLFYSGVNRYTRGHSGVRKWIQKSIPNKTECCIFWNDRITETRLKIHSGDLTILGMYAPA